MSMTSFNATQHSRTARDLNRKLRELESASGMPAAIHALEQQQTELGFIRADTSSIERWHLIDPAHPGRRLSVQFNPQRSLRPMATHGYRARQDGGCALCAHARVASQHYRQFGYELALGMNRCWLAWMNPYPLFQAHFVAATQDHEIQDWIVKCPNASTEKLSEILDVLLTLTARLPGFVGFHNSPGAGATQPHLHLQLFERPGFRFALEEAAACTDPKERGTGTPVAQHHPVPTMYFQGTRATVTSAATGWVGNWLESHRDAISTLAANIIASFDVSTGMYDLYFTPRSRMFERVPMLSGRAASLEVLGELVLSSAQERDLLNSGQLTYERAWSMLAALDTPGMRRAATRPTAH